MKTIMKFGLFSLMAIFLLTGCKKDENPLIGKWECTYIDEYLYDFWEDDYYSLKGVPSDLGYAVTLEFVDGEKCIKKITYKGQSQLHEFKYTYSDNLMTDGKATYNVTFSGKTMNMSAVAGEEHMKYTYKKIK
jgi:hypothetical protein